jgi:hypothetical protein
LSSLGKEVKPIILVTVTNDKCKPQRYSDGGYEALESLRICDFTTMFGRDIV